MMGEQFRNHYFLAVRIGLLLVLEIYIVLSQSVLTGASFKVLLLLALFVGVVAGKELVERKKQRIFFGLAVGLLFIIFSRLGNAFLLLGIFLCYEVLTYLDRICSGIFCLLELLLFRDR